MQKLSNSIVSDTVGQQAYFLWLSFSLNCTYKVKNLFRKTAQYFLDTLHIWEATITP